MVGMGVLIIFDNKRQGALSFNVQGNFAESNYETFIKTYRWSFLAHHARDPNMTF